MDTSDKGREQTVAEGDEIPFIFSVVFAPAMIVYTVFKRITYLLSSGFGMRKTDLLSRPDHIFVMTSSQEYRTHGFRKVGKQLLTDGSDVMFLCSPSASSQMDDWRENGFKVESFRQLLRYVSVSDLIIFLVRAVVTTYELRRVTTGEFEQSSVAYPFNSIFLEYIKVGSIEYLVEDNPAIHTYSLMPYQAQATISERLYVYQHGTQRSADDDAWAATTFFPANILIWGDAWFESFEQLIHSESKIHITGSPWHDHLSQSGDEGSDWDILFIGGSQAESHSRKWARLYEEVVTNVVQACNNNGWSLAIKLHPVESRKWYRDRGYEQYIVEFDDMQGALNSVDVAVTHYSSAFVESIATGTPIVLSEVWSYGLSDIRPVKGARFVENSQIEREIESLREVSLDSKHTFADNRLLNIGESVDQIGSLVAYGN